MDKTVIVVPGATQKQLELFKKIIEESPQKTVFISSETQVFKLVDGELFEVVPSLKKVVEMDEQCLKKLKEQV